MFHKIIYTILGFGIAFIFFPHLAKDSPKKTIVSGATTSIQRKNLASSPEFARNLSAPDLTAKSALALDLDSGSILYSKNLDEKLPIASLTKLVSALVVLDHTNLDSNVIVTKDDTTTIGSTIGLVVGEQVAVSDLLKAMLIPSANDAALTLANFVGPEGQFIDLMNQKVKNLGLTNTHFSNPVGWDSDENYSNALDLTKVVQEFLTHPDLSQIVRTKEAVISSVDKKYYHKLSTTNKLLLDDPDVIGIKTGFTSEALGNLIILADPNDRKIVTIVLGSENREDDSQKLLDWILQAYKW